MAAAERRAVGASPTLSASLETLRGELRRARCDVGPLDLDALASGDPAGYLPLLHFAVLRLSKLVARWVTELGYELYAKSDARFVEGVFRLMRTELNFRHSLTPKQFLTVGFAENKMLLVVQLLRLVRAKHADMARERGPKKAADHQALAELAVPRAHAAVGPSKATPLAVAVRQQKATDSPVRRSSKSSPLAEQKARQQPSTPRTQHHSRTRQMSTPSEQAPAPLERAALTPLAHAPSSDAARVLHGAAASPSAAGFASAASPASVIELGADGHDWAKQMRSAVGGMTVRRPEAFVGRSLELSSNLGAANYESDDSDGSSVEVLPATQGSGVNFSVGMPAGNDECGDAGGAFCEESLSDLEGTDGGAADGRSGHQSCDAWGSCFLTQLPDDAENTASDEDMDDIPASQRASNFTVAAPAATRLRDSEAAESAWQWEGDLAVACVQSGINGRASDAGHMPGDVATGPGFALRTVSRGHPGLASAPPDTYVQRTPACNRGILGLGIDYGLGSASVARGKHDPEQMEPPAVLRHSLQLPPAWPTEASNGAVVANWPLFAHPPLSAHPAPTESAQSPMMLADEPPHALKRETMRVDSAAEARLPELEHMISHACGQFEALRAHSDASFAKVQARLALLEGRMKLCEAALPGSTAHDAHRGWAALQKPCAVTVAGPPPTWPSTHAGAAAAGARRATGTNDARAVHKDGSAEAARAIVLHGTAPSPQPSTRQSPPGESAAGGPTHSLFGDLDAALPSPSGADKLVATRERAPPAVPPTTNQFIALMQRRLDETQSLLRESAAAGLTRALR
jgi:hypothetical protein